MIKRIAGGALALLASGALVFGVAGTASAAPIKDCGTTTEPVHGSNVRTTTTTQTSACNSNSDTGRQTTSVVTNGGGNQPPGQQ